MYAVPHFPPGEPIVETDYGIQVPPGGGSIAMYAVPHFPPGEPIIETDYGIQIPPEVKPSPSWKSRIEKIFDNLFNAGNSNIGQQLKNAALKMFFGK